LAHSLNLCHSNHQPLQLSIHCQPHSLSLTTCRCKEQQTVAHQF
jgi:hypothetical protein